MTKGKQGFASMDPEKQRAIAAQGGRASGGQFKAGDERTKAAARKGGLKRPKKEIK